MTRLGNSETLETGKLSKFEYLIFNSYLFQVNK